ncbi:amidohydrolase family protein [Endozoicomonadaceae bacterium StTr2]
MTHNDIPVCAGPLSPVSASAVVAPKGSCDCHAHVFGPLDSYPLVANRTYTPPPASLQEYRQMLGFLGLERGVIVQPSVYGTDNRATLEATVTGGDNFRAVVVVDEDISREQLAEMHAQGARGVRLNLLFRSEVNVSNLKRLAEKIAEFGWHLQLLIDVSVFPALYKTLAGLPVDVVFDHMGHMSTANSLEHPGFQEMLQLVAENKAWVKLSGAYRITTEKKAPYHDVTPMAQSIIETSPERVVWASDWPHPHIPVSMPDDGHLLDMLALWAPDEQLRQQILVSNPARLYGFAE